MNVGYDVVALARTPLRADDLEAVGVTVVEGDITQGETPADPMEGLDGVFRFAGWYVVGAGDPSLDERITVEGTRTVLAVMENLAVPKGVYTSTVAVNSDTGGEVLDDDYSSVCPHLTTYDRMKWE